MKTMKINGKEYELHFGKSFLRKLETDAGISITHLEDHFNKEMINTSLNMLHIALIEGARKSGKDFQLSIDDLADAWDNDEGLIDRFTTLLNASLNQEDSKNSMAPGRK